MCSAGRQVSQLIVTKHLVWLQVAWKSVYLPILTYLYSDSDLMESLDLERTTFYKRKKEAINMLGTILWGYVIPGLDHPDGLVYVADEPAAYHVPSVWRTQCEHGTNQKWTYVVPIMNIIRTLMLLYVNFNRATLIIAGNRFWMTPFIR